MEPNEMVHSTIEAGAVTDDSILGRTVDAYGTVTDLATGEIVLIQTDAEVGGTPLEAVEGAQEAAVN